MTPPRLTYARYRALGGRLMVDAFTDSLGAAEARVRAETSPNLPRDEWEREAWDRAVRAAVEVDSAYGASGGVGESASSVSIGGFSATYRREGGSGPLPYDRDMRAAIRRELCGTSLLYRGVS